MVFDLAAAFTDARFRGVSPGDDHIPGAVPIVLAGGATWNVTDGLALTARLRHFGATPLIEDNSVRSDKTTLFNVGGSYSSGQLRVGIDIYNLFDVRTPDISYFYTSRLPGEAAAGVEDRHVHPAQPRQILATARLRF